MISEKQLEANRSNAQRSTGPKTGEGKQYSSRNNLRHGLTGHISLLPTEDRQAHDAFCNELSDSLKPETPMERQFALADARTFQANANQFQLLTIYEQRINRNIQRDLKQLHDLKTERREQSEHALEEARLLAQLSLMKGLP